MAFGGMNRRGSKRFNLHTDIILQKETSSMNAIKGITKDLSMGGACCLIPLSIKVFTIVKIKIFSQSEETPIEISGRITWIREVEDSENELGRVQEEDGEELMAFMIGVQFLTLYSTKKEKLKKVLETYDNG